MAQLNTTLQCIKTTFKTLIILTAIVFFITFDSYGAVNINIEEWQSGNRTSGKLPVMHINTENGDSILDKENYLAAGMWIDIPENCPNKDFALGSEMEPVSLQIKGRGNSTWHAPKKPYKIKFTKKTATLGMPKHKHFALLANYGNVTGWAGQIMGMELGRLLGMPWAPRSEPVELILNGTYEGLYFCFESMKIGENRLNIYEQPEENTDSKTIPYGWLVEIDNYTDEFQITVPENPETNRTMHVTHKSPEMLSPEQRNWLIDEFTGMCETIYNPETAENWIDYIEPSSLARYYIVREIMTDYDGFNGSTYMHRDISGDTRWHFGPLWDCSLGYYKGDAIWAMDNLPTHTVWKLIPGIYKTTNFRKAFVKEWEKFYPEQYNKIRNFLHEAYQRVEDADHITWQRWGESYVETSPALIEYCLNLLDKKAVFMNKFYNEQKDITTGVDDEINDIKIIDECYYSFDGITVTNPSNRGIYIKSIIYSDGSTKNTKFIVK